MDQKDSEKSAEETADLNVTDSGTSGGGAAEKNSEQQTTTDSRIKEQSADKNQTVNESSDRTEQVPVQGSSEAESSGMTETTEQNSDADAAAQIYQEESDDRKAQKRVREAAQKENEEAASRAAHESYVIQPGDTLFQISMDRYGSVEAIAQICALNGITADQIIYPGEVIVLP